MTRYTDEDLLKEARRELAMRKRKYPEWVAEGRMRQDDAARQLELMGLIVLKLGPPAPVDLFSIVKERAPT